MLERRDASAALFERQSSFLDSGTASSRVGARVGGLHEHLTTREQQLEGKAAVIVQPRSGSVGTAFERPVERLVACARSGGKTAYPDQLTALRELREMQWRGLPLKRAYQCDHCGFWHLTKLEQRKE